MKKIISLLLAMLMLISLAVPAFASSKSKLGTEEYTGEHYEEFTSFFRDIYDSENVFVGRNFIIETSKIYGTKTEVFGGGGGHYTKIYPKDGSSFYITRVEASVSSYARDYGKVGVTAGNKRETEGVGYYDIVHVDDIDSNEFAFSGGEEYVGFDMIRVYYECAGEHTWDENDKCEICGICKCKVTGEHKAVLACSLCGEELSEGVSSYEGGIASTVSGGNITIIACMASAAAGMAVMFLIMRKKKEV